MSNQTPVTCPKCNAVVVAFRDETEECNGWARFECGSFWWSDHPLEWTQACRVRQLEREVAELRKQLQTPKPPPWQHLINEERDGVWAGFSAWEEWLKSRMRPEAAEVYGELDDDEAWKENLYAAVAGVLS